MGNQFVEKIIFGSFRKNDINLLYLSNKTDLLLVNYYSIAELLFQAPRNAY